MKDSEIRELFSRRNEYREIRYDLGNIRALCRALGEPQRDFRSVLIAGTNGKGVVCRWIQGMLPDAGLFVSPHLTRLNERISIGGREISDPELDTVYRKVNASIETAKADLAYPPTYFEFVTAMAFAYFAGRTRYAVVEVGLGGRLDATNVLAQDASVITSIGLDHQEYLGATREAIAGEKAGIIKSDEPVIVGPGLDLAPIVERAGDRLIDAGQVRFETRELGGGLYDVDLSTPTRVYKNLRPRLAGRHQLENLAVAVSAGEVLERRGWPISSDSIVDSVNRSTWPGRLESVPGAPPLLLDGGHNPDAAVALARYLGEYHPGGITLIFGTMADKDFGAMLRILKPHARRVLLTRPPGSRAADPNAVREVHPEATVIEAPSEAIQFARKSFPDDTILVAGSLYLVGHVRTALGLESADPVSQFEKPYSIG